MSDLLGLPCVHGEDATLCDKCWDEMKCPCGHLLNDHDGMGDCRKEDRRTLTGYCRCEFWKEEN